MIGSGLEVAAGEGAAGTKVHVTLSVWVENDKIRTPGEEASIPTLVEGIDKFRITIAAAEEASSSNGVLRKEPKYSGWARTTRVVLGVNRTAC